MSFIITSQSVVAYSQCIRKAFLLQCTDEIGAINEYEEVIKKRRIENQRTYTEALRGNQHELISYTPELLQNKNSFDYLLNAVLRRKDLHAECDLLERSQNENSPYYVPYIFTGTYNISQSDKLRLLFAGYVLGEVLKKWIVYQRVALRLSYANIVMILEEMFDEPLTPSQTTKYLQDVAQEHIETEGWMIQQLVESPFLHVDETSLNIDYLNKYVWVFTNGKYLIFKYTETREASFVREFLKDYKGILISDFYPGYDALKCRHQKCLVHLIRDLNNDLYTNPFDSEFQQFVSIAKEMVIPIMEAMKRYGLKTWHLKKFKKAVEKFYAETITNMAYRSELCSRYQDRFTRYREHLFTFLEYDRIPWHNNTAENALRHITLQENSSGVFHSSVLKEYLLLLGIRQSCKFQKRSFLEFLISEKKTFENIHS